MVGRMDTNATLWLVIGLIVVVGFVIEDMINRHKKK